MNRIVIDNIAHSYMELHYLLEIMGQVIESRINDYENSDISCLFSVITDKRNYFYNCFNRFINSLLK